MRPAVTALGVVTVLLPGCSATTPSPAEPVVQVRAGDPVGQTITGLIVERVVDGDTIRVRIDGTEEPVRLIGIDTPETVKPESPVECFGPEASEFAQDTLDGQPVVLEFDDSQGRRDRYDRVLAYVWRVLPDGSLRLFNEEAVAAGYAVARQYGPEPPAWMDVLDQAQESARSAQAGLWGACSS